MFWFLAATAAQEAHLSLRLSVRLFICSQLVFSVLLVQCGLCNMVSAMWLVQRGKCNVVSQMWLVQYGYCNVIHAMWLVQCG